MNAFRSWIQQPTTIAGVSALLGTVVALLMHQVTWVQAVPLLAGAAVSTILPDNSNAKQQAQLLAGTMVAKFTSEQAVKIPASTQTTSGVAPLH